MAIIFRGAGILVPIIFFLSAYCVYLAKGTVDNFFAADYLCWVMLYAAIPVLLLGLALWGGQESGEGQDKNKDHFWFVPVWLWGGIFSVFCLIFFFTPSYDPTKVSYSTEVPELAINKEDTIPHWINFYNPTSDTLSSMVADKYGNNEQGPVSPMTSFETLAIGSSFLLASTNGAGELLMSLPAKKDFDKSKYELVKDGKESFYQRKLPVPNKNKNDYDGNWLMMHPDYDMAVINISDLYVNNKVQRDKVAKINWTSKIVNEYMGDDLMEVNIQPKAPATAVGVTYPDFYVPAVVKPNTGQYLMIVHHMNDKLTNEFLIENLLNSIKSEE